MGTIFHQGIPYTGLGTPNTWGEINGTLSNQSDLNTALTTISGESYNINDTAETDIANNDYIPFFDTSANAKKKSLWSNIINKLKTYFDGIYVDEDSLATVATTGAYSDLTGKPSLATVATTGSYSDLTNEPTNQSASSGSSTVSLCTRGEKYTWNNKSDVKTSSAAASGGTTLSLCTTGEKYIWNNKSNAIKVVGKTYSVPSSQQSLPANTGYLGVTFNVNTESGYTPIAIVGISKSGSAQTLAIISDFYINSSKQAVVWYRNESTSACTVTSVSFSILYLKD